MRKLTSAVNSAGPQISREPVYVPKNPEITRLRRPNYTEDVSRTVRQGCLAAVGPVVVVLHFSKCLTFGGRRRGSRSRFAIGTHV